MMREKAHGRLVLGELESLRSTSPDSIRSLTLPCVRTTSCYYQENTALYSEVPSASSRKRPMPILGTRGPRSVFRPFQSYFFSFPPALPSLLLLFCSGLPRRSAHLSLRLAFLPALPTFLPFATSSRASSLSRTEQRKRRPKEKMSSMQGYLPANSYVFNKYGYSPSIAMVSSLFPLP